MTVGKPDGVPARQDKVTDTLVAGPMLGSVPAQPHPAADHRSALPRAAPSLARTEPSEAGQAATDTAITELFGAHYRPLVRLAALLVHDVSTAEEVVQDSFVALHAGLHRLRDSEKALAYLRAAVVNRSRSVLRHRVVVDRNAPKAAPDMPSAEHGALALIERSEVVAALRELPARQREVVVLRFYADLSEAQIALAMGITRGAVKSHTSRAMTALRSVLERET
jgi:RNA polymerase sigma-70 factor (sigma-E family)